MNFNIVLRSGTIAILGALFMTSVVLADEFTLISPTLQDKGTLPNAHVFNGFGCNGTNRSPEIKWKNVPAGTESFAVTAFDPDAPTDSGWWHWLAYNLPKAATGVSEDAGRSSGDGLPEGTVQARSDFGSVGFGGACPPEGAKPHRYIFTVYALKVKSLELPGNASAALTSFMIKANSIGQASLTAFYGR